MLPAYSTSNYPGMIDDRWPLRLTASSKLVTNERCPLRTRHTALRHNGSDITLLITYIFNTRGDDCQWADMRLIHRHEIPSFFALTVWHLRKSPHFSALWSTKAVRFSAIDLHKIHLAISIALRNLLSHLQELYRKDSRRATMHDAIWASLLWPIYFKTIRRFES